MVLRGDGKLEDVNGMKTGTTTVGVVVKDGIVFAADKRATMGNLIADKHAKKVIPINDRLVMTISGMVGDAQMLIKFLSTQVTLYEIRRKQRMSVKAAATLLSNILYGNRFTIPFYVHFLLGGYDETGFHLYELLPDGSVSENDYIATGSGSVFSYGVLDANYKKGMKVEDGIKLAAKAVNAGMQRDVFSGEGISMFVLTKSGVEEISESKIKKLLSS